MSSVAAEHLDVSQILTALTAVKKGGVTAAESVGAAMAAFHRARPDIIVSDIGMPGQDGQGLIQQLRAGAGSERPVPAIAFTAYAGPEARERALAAGFHAHLAKPADTAELVQLVLAVTAARSSMPSVPD